MIPQLCVCLTLHAVVCASAHVNDVPVVLTLNTETLHSFAWR
jgi:hypothetical protein